MTKVWGIIILVATSSFHERGVTMYNSQLDAFIAAADSGSFAKAADKLYISAPAVIKQINTLEQHLNIKLFNRSPRGITLTEAGQSLYKDAVKIIRLSNAAIERARTLAKNQPCIIRVGNSMMNPCKPLVDLWKQISNLYPNLKLQIIPYDDSGNTVLNVLDTLGKDFDIFVAPCNSEEWFKRCNFYQLGTYKICCAVPQGHRLSEQESITLNDLSGETLMMCQRGDSKILDGIRDYLNKDYPEIVIKDTSIFYDASVLNQCDQEGNILLTLDAWTDVHPFLQTIMIEWDYTMPYGIIYPKDASQNVLSFLEALKAHEK